MRKFLYALLAVFSAESFAAENQSLLDEAQFLDDLRVGHWVEVRGTFSNDLFAASRIELRQPSNRFLLWGTARPGQLTGELNVLGRRVIIEQDALRSTPDLENLMGTRVRVHGVVGPQQAILANRIDDREPGVDRLEGRIDEIATTTAGDYELSIAGFTVQVPREVRQRIEIEFDIVGRTLPTTLVSSSTRIGDLDDAFGEGLQIGGAFHIGLQQSIGTSSQNNFELDRRDDDDIDADDNRDRISHSLRARMTWAPSARITSILDVDHRYRRSEIRDTAQTTDSDYRLREAFVLLRDVGFGGDLIIGRQDFDDPREWLYDQNLDGIRYFRQTSRLNWEVSTSTTLADGSSRDEDAVNSILYVSNRESPIHAAGYVVNRNFGGSRNERQTHAGLRLIGPLWEQFDAWVELAHLTGNRRGRDIKAWGGDVGFRWVTDTSSRLTFTAGYAYGSGDDDNGDDNRFRQTGLQDNNGRLGGVTAVRYYGELFEPELSNMHIATVGVGARFLGRNSIELIGHKYRQAVAAQRLTRTNLDVLPDGINKDLGWEVDLVLGIRRFRNWEVELIGSYFSPGDALGSGDFATFGTLRINYQY